MNIKLSPIRSILSNFPHIYNKRGSSSNYYDQAQKNEINFKGL